MDASSRSGMIVDAEELRRESTQSERRIVSPLDSSTGDGIGVRSGMLAAAEKDREGRLFGEVEGIYCALERRMGTPPMWLRECARERAACSACWGT